MRALKMQSQSRACKRRDRASRAEMPAKFSLPSVILLQLPHVYYWLQLVIFRPNLHHQWVFLLRAEDLTRWHADAAAKEFVCKISSEIIPLYDAAAVPGFILRRSGAPGEECVCSSKSPADDKW